MNWQPMLGFHDGAHDLSDPALYEETRRDGMTLPAFAYRSKAFADLEDEKVWTRSWSCIGYADRIPNPGDLYPFTVGQHGVHVQRQPDGSLKAHFNFAQHGGCRFVPRQCQTGKKTTCFYTSCGHSRDRDVVIANPDGSDTPEMYMFVGVNPLKLIPIHLATVGSLMFVNLDFDSAPLAAQWENEAPVPPSAGAPLTDHASQNDAGSAIKLGGLTQLLSDASAHRTRHECELACNWKLAGKLALEALDAGEVTAIEWRYPNLVIARSDTMVIASILQPVAMNATRVITDVFTSHVCALDDAVLAAVGPRLARLADTARALQRAIAGPDDPSPFLPQAKLDTNVIEEPNLDVRRFNAQLVRQILTKHHYVERPLYTNPGRSLNAGVNSGAF